jgi:hypothetical protein
VLGQPAVESLAAEGAFQRSVEAGAGGERVEARGAREPGKLAGPSVNNATALSLLVRARGRIGAGHRTDEAVGLRLDDVTPGRPDLRERAVAQVRLHEVADRGDEVPGVPGTTSSSRVQNAA